MRYGQIRKYDIANGPGIRTSLFVTGCTHHCFNCFNEEYQDFKAGEEFTEKEIELICGYLLLPEVSGLTILGGEPFQNIEGLHELLNEIESRGISKSIWIYSGYTYDQILADPEKLKLMERCDVLVDGKFMESLKDPSLRFRGSSNQNIIDITQSLVNDTVTLYL